MLNRKDINQYCESILQNLARNLNIVQGVFYIKKRNEENFEAAAHYAYYSDETPPSFRVGETLPGQAVKDNRIVAIQNIPENYISVVSGLGNSKPRNLIMVPVYANKEPVGLIEFAVFTSLDTDIESALKEISVIIGKNILKLMY
ncbi:MAG TPA: GAF domain-containing protein [Bacteroidales bacterium]|nr:GAF domain-containing protein [Bacteroidales bacterium]